MSHAVQMNGLFVGELLRRARIHLKRKVQPVHTLQGLYESGQRGDELIAAQAQRILPLDIATDIRDDLIQMCEGGLQGLVCGIHVLVQ